MTDGDDSAPWLSLVGLGADGVASLAPGARQAIERASLVVGAPRQLELVRPLVHGETMTWPSPLAEGLPRVFARRGSPTCVLASGDPFWYGIGGTLAPQLVRGEFVCYPAPSSLALAASRLGWALQDVDVVSLHGRDLHEVVRYLQRNRRVLALSWDQRTPRELAALLVERGFEATMHVLELLGAANERVRSVRASEFALTDVADLNLIALELSGAGYTLPCRGSLPDELFEHDGQLTKQDVRNITLSALAPRPGELLWDVGAGSGSIAIEWMLAHPACAALALERDPARCERIQRNASKLGTPRLQLRQGSAPDALTGLPTPDAIFIGGGGGQREIFERCWAALRPGGRLVINGVSLETEAHLNFLYGRFGGSLRRISIELAEPLGGMTGFRPQRAITQWCVHKETT